MEKNRETVRWITRVGVLAAMAIVLAFLETGLLAPLPFMPPFLQLDISDVPALLAAFAMGPLAGVAIEIVKNAVKGLIMSSSVGIGELANMIIGSAFVTTAALIYRRKKDRAHAYLGMAAGMLAMTAVAVAANYFVLLPLYFQFMPLETMIGLANAAGNTLVKDLPTFLLYVFVPFNLVKGLIVSVLTGLVYKRVSPLLHGVSARK